MRISSKKILAVVLSVAMLLSCMVFSFSANADINVAWQNDFDNEATSGNWWITLPKETATTHDDYTKVKDGSRSAAYDATAGHGGDGAIKLNLNNTQYAAGFRFYDEDDSKNDFNSSLTGNTVAADYAKGKVQVRNQYYPLVVNFAYKLNSATAPVDLYVAVGGYYWTGDWNANVPNLPNTNQHWKAVSLDAEDAGEWHYASVYLGIPTVSQGLHIFAQTAEGTSNVTAEVIIDDVKIINHGSKDAIHKLTYIHNNDVVGFSEGYDTSYGNTLGLDIDVPADRNMEFYSDPAMTPESKLDIPCHGAAVSNVFIKMVADENAGALYTETYERFADKASWDVLEDNGNSYEDLYKFGSNNAATLTGNGSGRIVSNKFAEEAHGITQGFINAWDNNLALTAIHSSESANIVPKAGASYVVTFDVWANAATVNVSLMEHKNGSFSDTKVHTNDMVALEFGDNAEWQTVTLKLDNATANELLMLAVGVDNYSWNYESTPPAPLGNYPPVVYIDNVAVTEYVPAQDAEADSLVQSFENVKGSLMAHGGTGWVSDITGSNYRTGNRAIWMNPSANGGDNRTQFNIPTIEDPNEYVTAEADTYYRVSFWVLPAADNPTGSINFWLAAMDVNHNPNDGVTAHKKSNYTLYESDGNIPVVKGYWNKITFVTNKLVNTGATTAPVMRLGVCGGANSNHNFYIDDLLIEEIVSEIPGAWSFEKEEDNRNISVNTSCSAQVINDSTIARTGDKCLKVKTHTTPSGANRPQIYLKDAAGANVTLQANKDYIVTFYVRGCADSAARYSPNMWFMAGNGSESRDSSNFKDANKLLDDIGGYCGYRDPDQSEWVKVTRYLSCGEITKTNLLMGISSTNASSSSIRSAYIDDISVVCVDDLAIAKADREQFLFNKKTADGVETNLHTRVDKDGNAVPGDTGVYTSVRLGATYRSTAIDGSTIVIDGIEYDVVKRGIVVGKKDDALVPTDDSTYTWKSEVPATEDGFNSFDTDAVAIADGAAQYNVTYTLRLANMPAKYFNESTTEGAVEYQYRSYYVLKTKYYPAEASGTTEDVTFDTIVYGTTSRAFTFKSLTDGMHGANWFEFES